MIRSASSSRVYRLFSIKMDFIYFKIKTILKREEITSFSNNVLSGYGKKVIVQKIVFKSIKVLKNISNAI